MIVIVVTLQTMMVFELTAMNVCIVSALRGLELCSSNNWDVTAAHGEKI